MCVCVCVCENASNNENDSWSHCPSSEWRPSFTWERDPRCAADYCRTRPAAVCACPKADWTASHSPNERSVSIARRSTPMCRYFLTMSRVARATRYHTSHDLARLVRFLWLLAANRNRCSLVTLWPYPPHRPPAYLLIRFYNTIQYSFIK